VLDPVAAHTQELARRVKSWHAQQGDPLPLARCRHLVAVLHGHVGWAEFQVAAQTGGDPGFCRLEVDRLKQFGYTADAAQSLVEYLTR
jgi:hypothetical protein